jgi:hypothetical protein
VVCSRIGIVGMDYVDEVETSFVKNSLLVGNNRQKREKRPLDGVLVSYSSSASDSALRIPGRGVRLRQFKIWLYAGAIYKRYGRSEGLYKRRICYIDPAYLDNGL